MRTHYDNLHIPRDASADDIRNAYRRLSKQYHPDYNSSTDAHRIMQIINRAYDVLSNPERRAEHDHWIVEQEKIEAAAEYKIVVQTKQTVVHQAVDSSMARNKTLLMGMVVFCVGLTALLGWQITRAFHLRQEADLRSQAMANVPVLQPENVHVVYDASAVSPALAAQPITASQTVTTHAYIRPNTAPNGKPFPQYTAYIDGYPQVRSQNGQSRIYVENIRNTSDVFAELYTVDNPQVLRTFFIRERSQITLDGLDFGAYAIRYRQLDDGEELHSENIILSSGAREATIYLQKGHAPTIAY